MYVFIISLCIVAVAFVAQRFANQIDEHLNACGTGSFKDGKCVCTHPYTGTHCEIVDCGYGKLVDSVFAYDTITTPKGPTGCECESQYWGYNCANCTSKSSAQCTGPCKATYFGSRCDIMCKSGTEHDELGVEHREAGGTYNYFEASHGFCLNYGDVKGTVKCKEGRAGAHCELQCPLCVYGSCNLDDGTCDCFDGYFGNLCEGTCPNRCSGLNGVCQEDGTCKCYDGFTGDDCSLECCVEGRGTELSSVHGTCLEDVGGCNCSNEIVPVDLPDELYSETPFHGVGWEGSQCDCHENITCGGRGRCVEGGCECTGNFQGARCDICNDSKVGPFCQYDRWQCPDRENANGEFVAKNSRGDYGCKCNSGFTGDTCEECIASAYPKSGDNMCTIIVPESLCHAGSVNPDYDKTNDMCICDTNFDTQTDCASCHEHWYGPGCDYYCRESTEVDAVDCGSTGGVCSNSGPGCICPKGSIFSGTKAGGTCVTCGGDEGCINGNCIEGRCRCDPNYYGDNCNITAPKSGDKVCSGYPSVIIETDASCALTADCLDESEDAPVKNQMVAHKARIYDRIDQMFCHRDDTPKGLKNTQGCCVDKNGDGFCDKDKLESIDSCTFINAAGNPEEGEVVNDICNNRVLEDETNVFEWCLSKNRSCTANGVCEDPELCENRCDASLGPAEWIKIWEWEHSRTMADVMSESWKFASDFPDPYEYRDTYLPSFTRAHDGECKSGPEEAGTGAKTVQECADKCSGMMIGSVQAKGFVFSETIGGQQTNQAACFCEGATSHPHPDCGGTETWGTDWIRYDFPSNFPTIDDVCVAGEMYDVCRDYLIPDDANVFNMTHKFTDKWETMPNYQDCTLTKVISVNVDGKQEITINPPIYAGVLETTEDNTAVFGRYQNGEAAYTGTVNHMIDSITVFGKGFTGANKLTILIYNYTSDTCSDFVKKVGSHYDLCSQIKFHELDYDWGAFCKWRPTTYRSYELLQADSFCSNTIYPDGDSVGGRLATDHSLASTDLAQECANRCSIQGYTSFYVTDYWTSDGCVCGLDDCSSRVHWNTHNTNSYRIVTRPPFEDRCYRQSTVCTAGCDNYQEGCEGLPLLSEHPTPMPAPCDQHWDDFCENYMDYEHKEEGVCAYTECRCEGYGVGGPACDMQCPVPTGVDTELSCGSDLNMGRCIKDRGVIAFGVEQGKCDCFNGGNPAEGCTATCEEGTQDCSSQIDTPFSFEYSNCSALSNIDTTSYAFYVVETTITVGSYVNSVAWSVDGSKIASGSDDMTVRVWNSTTGNELLKIEGHTDWVWSVSFSPDGSRIVSGSQDKTVRVWDIQTGNELMSTEHPGPVYSVAWSPDGSKIVSGSGDNTVWVWDSNTGNPIGILTGHTDSVWSVSFSPDGSKIASGSDDKTVRVWDIQTGTELMFVGHNSKVYPVSWSPDGSKIVSGSKDYNVRVWDSSSGALIHNLTGHTSYVISASFSPDGSKIVSGSNDKTVRVWDSNTGNPIGIPLEGHDGSVRWGVSFSPDGSRIVSGSGDKTVRVWEPEVVCHVLLRDSACNFFRGRCECATPFTAYTEEEKPIYLNPHNSYRIALMQGYDIDEYLAFTTYDGTRPDRDREAFDDFDPNFKCFKDLEHTVEVSCDWIRALKHFARGGSYRIGDCTNLAPGTDIEYQVPCSGHGFPQGGTCACDYAEEFETRSSGVGLSFEQPGLTETPWRGKACQFVCPGYDMKTMSSVCSGHGRCETDGRCACDQGWTGYKCDLQCEAEQKPLTCSGHGVCDERSIVLRGDIVTQLDNSRCDHLPECNAENYASGPCTNETMTLARDRVIKSGDFTYHMYYDEAIKVSTYSSALSSTVEFLSLDTLITWTKIFDGECDDGKEINMYEGDGDNSGSDYVEKCAQACLNTTRTPITGSWDYLGSALGFIVAPNGRCWCESADSSTCTQTDSSYDRYDFIEEPSGLTVRNADAVSLNPDINVCSDFTLKKIYKADGTIGGPVILSMIDSYGDGWNGFQLSVGGNEYGSTFVDGTSKTQQISNLNGPIEVNKVSPGSYPHEVSFEIRCEQGNYLLLSGGGYGVDWTFENTCPTDLTGSIEIKKDSTLVAILTEIGEFSVTEAEINDVYTYSDIISSLGGSLTVVNCSTVTRNAVVDDFSIEGTAVRHDYDFGSNIPFMPCQDRMSISREHPAHPLLPEMSSVDLECNMLAQKQVTENGADYFKSYQIMCGVCNCEESSQTGNWTGYDCRTPALGFYRSNARSQCPGMTADMNPCNGGGTCRWGSTDGLGTQIRDAASKCYCGDVTDEATLETAPRSEYGVLVHASSHGTPLFYDEIDVFEKATVLLEYNDIQPSLAVCNNLRGLPYALDTMDPDYETRKRACYDACANVNGTNKIVSDSSAESYLTFWDDISHANGFMVSAEVPKATVVLYMFDSYGDGWNGYDVVIDGNSYTLSSGYSGTASISGMGGTVSVAQSDGSFDGEVSWDIRCGDVELVSGVGRGSWSFTTVECPLSTLSYVAPDHSHCFCVANSLEGCPDADIATSWDEMDAFDITAIQCPTGTEPIKHAKDCLHGFKTDEPFSLIPSFQYCEMPDKTDQVLTIDAGQTGSVDNVTFSCYDSCINGQKLDIGGEWSDPLFWSKHTKEDITHFSVVTDTYDKGWCVCYATNVDDCKDGDASVPLTSTSNTISYRINHHSHPYDLTTGSSNTIPALSSLTTGTCQKEFAEEVFTDKDYGPTITYKASSAVCKRAFELDGTEIIPDKDTKVYSTRLQETDPLYDRDPAQECANRCNADAKGYDGFMILSYVSSGNINSCLCGKNCDTVQSGFPYFKMYSMRTVPDPYKTDNTQSICHPSPLQLSNYKSDCSCKFGFTGNTCETPRMMCLWNGEETDGTECICNDNGELNPKVSKYGCCTKGTYWDQDKYASFTPLSEFEPLPPNRFYQDAFLYVCKPPETLLDYETDQDRIIDIHNYVANTDEYLLTKPAVCGDAPETRLFTSTLQTLTSKSPDTFTVTRGTGDDARSIVVDKDKTILELKEGSEPKEQCAAFCVSKNKGYKGFSIFTPTPEMVKTSDKIKNTDAGAPNVRCENDDRVQVYGDMGIDTNPGLGLGDSFGPMVDACWAACTFRPRVSKTKANGYADSRPQNFWDVYGPDDITYMYIFDLIGGDAGSAQGRCSCHTGDLDTCETVEAPAIQNGALYGAHTYKVVRGDTECTCEPFIANMDDQEEFKDPMSYEDNEGWSNALPRTTERYDIQFPVDIEAEAQNLGCFENIDGRVLKIDQLSGTSHSISAVETAYVDASSARSSVGGTLEDCYEECKYDDVFTYGFTIPELPRYNFEGTGSCISPNAPFSTSSRVLSGHTSGVNSVAWSPDGSKIVSGSGGIVSESGDKTVRVWDSYTGAELLELTVNSIMWSVAWSPDGSKIVSGSGDIVYGSWDNRDNTVRVWDAVSGVLEKTLEGHTSYVWSVSFSPDGSRIASGSGDITVRVWDSQTGAELMKLEGHTDSVRSVSFSPDGSRIVSGSEDKTVRVWDVDPESETNGECVLGPLEGHTDGVISVAWSPDGFKIVSGSYDKTVRVWDAVSGVLEKTLEGHTGWVFSVDWHGDKIVSGSSDNTVRVWDTVSGELLTTLGGEGHTNWVNSVSFSPDGLHIASGRKDGEVDLWSRKTEGEHLESSVVSDASECYNNCRYKAGFSGFVFKQDNGDCVCTTIDQTDCSTSDQSYDRYSVSDDYMVDQFTEVNKDDTDGFCYGMPGTLRTYDTGENPGEDLAGKTRACYDACANVDGDNIVSAKTSGSNPKFWEDYNSYNVINWIVAADGKCYCYTDADDIYNCDEIGKTWKDLDANYGYDVYRRNPPPEDKTCTCYSEGRGQIITTPISDVFQVTGTSVGTLMTVQKNPAVNPAPCNVNSYIALGDDIVGDPCNCPIGALEEAYIDVGFERAIVNGRCKDYTSAKFKFTKEECETACENDPRCDSYSYAKDDVDPCRTAINCAGFEYKFEGVCGWGDGIKEDRDVGVLPNIKACRDRCADYRGFLYSESYRKCVCEDNEMTDSGSTCLPRESYSASDKYTRYQHNFEPTLNDATIMVRQPLTTSKGRYCATGEVELYTVSITDPRADVYACAQNATLQGMEVARGKVNGLTFTCYVSGTYYANPSVIETGIVNCGDFRTSGGPQYILQAGMQRRIGNELAAESYQKKAIKDDLFNSELYPSDTPEGCKVHCDPYKYRHFQFSNRDKTCQCIKKEKSLLTLTGDPNDMDYEIHDFSAGLIDSPHEMCFCEGFYLVDGQAQACPVGKYSSKLTPCSAACTNCPVGQFSDAGASECGACVAGQIQTSPTSCSKCAAGQYAKAGAIKCSKCETGKYAIGAGAGACTLCPTGKYQYPEATGTTTNTCQDCPEGWEQPNMEQTDCEICGKGKYTTSEGTTECSVCGSGKYQNQNGQTSADACHGCSAGQYQNQNGQSGCKNCAAGKYQSQTGKTSCLPCGGGKYQSQTGKTSCATCSAGKSSASGSNGCGTCSAGQYSSAGSSTCSPCNVGKYQTQAGQGSCITCPAAATTNYALGRFWNDVSRWGSVSGYGYSFFYPNTDRTTVNSCLYVQEGDYNLQGSNSAEGFNYDKVHCRYANQNNKINGYIQSKYVLRWCWIDRGNCRDVVNGAVFNYDLTETGRKSWGWKQCKPYHKTYRL